MATHAEIKGLLVEHLDDLYRLALWISGKQDQAEDLVHDASMKALRRADSFKGGKFKAWMSRILTNTHIDRYRKNKRQARTSDFSEFEPPYEEILEPAYFDPTSLEGWDEHVEDHVKVAIMNVPEEFRDVFLMFSLGDLSYREIADIMEIPLGTVMSRLYRARQLLKKELRAGAPSQPQDQLTPQPKNQEN